MSNETKIPEDIRTKLFKLKKMETELGHLPLENWALPELDRRTNDPDFPFIANQMEQETEFLFGDICEDLAAMNFTHVQIAEILNAVLQYAGGPKYCSESEVSESLTASVGTMV